MSLGVPETYEVTVRRVYGEDRAHVYLPDGSLEVRYVDSGGRVGATIPAPEENHTLGLATLGRAPALDALRSGQA